MISPLLINLKSTQHTEQGFGLLSMVFVILTLSIASVSVMTLINPSMVSGQNRETVLKAATLRSAITSYKFSHGGATGTNPTTLDDLSTTDAVACVLDNAPTNTTYQFLQGWCGPYVDQVFSQNLNDFKTDGWGTAFSYNAGTAVITSCGTDKSCGGVDDLTFNP